MNFSDDKVLFTLRFESSASFTQSLLRIFSDTCSKKNYSDAVGSSQFCRFKRKMWIKKNKLNSQKTKNFQKKGNIEILKLTYDVIFPIFTYLKSASLMCFEN